MFQMKQFIFELKMYARYSYLYGANIGYLLVFEYKVDKKTKN